MAAEMLSESDGALYAFAGVMLALYVVPATLFTAYRVVRTPKKLRSRGFALHLAVLAVAGGLLWRCLSALQSVDTSGTFDPYEILGVGDSASTRQIKKAFRALGRQLHPDKNLHNPLAAGQFARVTKAYEALTDPRSMENYRKYGHPDGRQSMLMDVAFASVLGGTSGSTGSVFVLVYFGVVFAGLVYVVYWLQKRAGRSDRTQISRATHASFVGALTEKMSVHDVVELLLSCDEMTGAAAGILDDARNAAQLRAKTHDKLAKKMEAAKALPSEAISRIRKHPDPVARENMLALYQYLRRDKLRGVSRPAWVDQRFQKVLLELPFLVDIFATMAAEQLVKRAYPAVPLLRALSLLSSIAQGSFVPDAVALREQSERIAAVEGKLPKLLLEGTTLAVLDEPNIQPGDWLTLQTTLTRQHLEAREKAPLAATFYDHVDPKSPFRKEHVWFLVMDKGTGRLYAAWKCLDLSQQAAQKAGFLGPEMPGKYEFEVRVVCPAYLDVQTKAALSVAVENR
ncbi:secretory subunit [Phytophthora pseudosyringae]|uniref:Secretory subunit n=1 Tax=Phytophthora pseudosyringae TaxID=221518 RepID=A0A8T1VL13_9STRA|nr:secretory subunit [Phytophthora pseudosyringae]